MAKSQLVLAFFENEAAANAAVESLKKWGKAGKEIKRGAGAVLVKDEQGKVKEHKLGKRKTKTGALVGALAGILSGGVTLFGGAIVGETARARAPMRSRDAVDLVLLAAIWGSSFLFIRIAAPAFGPAALVEVRMVSGALVLLPLLAAGIGLPALRRHASPIAVISVINFAVPFVLVTYAMLTLTSAFTSMLNATVPMWTALIAALWFGERVRPSQWVGLAIGAIGVLVLVGDKIELNRSGANWPETIAVGAALLGMMFYGLSANVARRTLAGVPPLATATGSQLGTAVLLAPAALLMWPAQPPSAGVWAATVERIAPHDARLGHRRVTRLHLPPKPIRRNYPLVITGRKCLGAAPTAAPTRCAASRASSSANTAGFHANSTRGRC